MIDVMNNHDSSTLSINFLEEYSTEESIHRYTKKTAGQGISYLLEHEYGSVYLDSIERYIPKSRLKTGIRIWEFGCGGGMNLLYLVSTLVRRGIRVDFACGTDFSETLVTAARSEANRYLPSDQTNKVRFTVARNENLVEEGAKGLGIGRGELLGSFDLLVGINTIRYAHRLNNVDRCLDGISALLRDEGVCIVIDMNNKFPAFRSRFRQQSLKHDEKATLLPTLDEYAQPFSSAGFKIIEKKNFCWIPHSAGPALTAVMKGLTPILNTVAPSRAMRSLVISQKAQSSIASTDSE
jgi:2-polyprenyl-3-methyl-5-hydroxy-6-metoxy-1,4-benzoquinol methylase